MENKQISEGTTATLSMAFFDPDGDAVVPATLRYRIDCVQNRQQIRDWTSLTPAAQVDVELTEDDNDNVTSRASEIHEVTVEATYGASGQITSCYRYTVKNLPFLQ